MRNHHKLLPPLLASVLLAVALFAQVRYPALFADWRNLAFDAYMSAHPAAPDAPITVVDIDERSIARYGAWPWPGSTLAALIDRSADLGATAIVLAAIPTDGDDCNAPDLIAEADDDSNADPSSAPSPGAPSSQTSSQTRSPISPLFRGLAALPSVIGFALIEGGSETRPPPQRASVVTLGIAAPMLEMRLSGRLLPADSAAEAAAGIGALNVFPDPDGRVRRVPLLVQSGDALYPSLAAEMLRVATDARSYLVRFEPKTALDAEVSLKIGDAVTRLNGNGEIWLHYAPRGAFPVVSATDVLDPMPDDLPGDAAAKGMADGMKGERQAEGLHDRVAVIGVSAPGIGAMITSPLGERLSPAELHAQTLAQLASGAHPQRPPWASGAEAAVAGAGSLLLILISLRRRGLWLVAPGVLMIGTLLAGGYLLFREALLLFDPVSPALTIAIVYATLTLTSYLVTDRERRWIQQAFSSYVSPTLVQHLIRHPEQLRLGGERRECSFVMTDLAGFTPLVERSSPEALVDLLNRYLDGLIGVVFRHAGTIDRIVGDAVSVRFSAPVHQPDHAQRALDCALAIDRFAREFAAVMRAQGVALGQTRIGVHTGEVIVGNFGGSRQLDYRAFGDAINTAARLESANKYFGTNLAVSAVTLKQCRDAAVRPIGNLLLKGKTLAIATFTPLTPAEIESGLAEHYERAYRDAEQGDADALAVFATCAERFPDDPLTDFHLRRLRNGEHGVVIKLEK